MSNRFYCPTPPREGKFRLDAEESRHLLRVCRHTVGDRVELFDGAGLSYVARVVECGKDAAWLEPEGPPTSDPAPPCLIEIGTAVPKGDRFDWLVEKAVELGVARLTPLITDRSVVDPRGSKLDRLRKTVVEASKQSGRSRLMDIDAPTNLRAFLERSDGLRLLADPAGVSPEGWPAIVRGAVVRLAVGPEGGFTEAERALAVSLGWRPIRLGPNILRIETAVLAGAAAILARCEPGDDQPVH
ncbi:MAG: RsmE family RNA methyltransferase [Paludisphaera borealis]|uniref:RsmE family RNA methyltransferase n=1 Tax=Paludisphaera borealis TaxID=1387353 RepID=UPI002848C694|nr:RsmE family RNA methyltransferase [Paludisphaera borealis]MDR3619577.1 RsmE family RNA methyltransferase [Paludisphaera borealis]